MAQIGNQMSKLVDKIERRLGTKALMLPKEVSKDTWPDVIISDSLDTFSRFFPRRIKVICNSSCKKDGWYHIDELLPDSVEIIGIQDIDWSSFAEDSLGAAQSAGYAYYDTVTTGSYFGPVDIITLQAAASHASMYNNGIYIETEPPNKVRFTNVTNGIININDFPINVFIKHAPNLMTISPTMMETFEKLAMADVASYLYEYLKYYDGIDTVFANVDLKLDGIADKARMREDIVSELESAHVGFANDGQPCIICQ